MTLRDLVDEARWCGHTPPLTIGCGASRRLSDLAGCPADRVLVVASQRAVRRVVGAARLIGLGAVAYHQVSPNPTTAQALALAEIIDSVRPHTVVAVGGGSAIDLAKAGRMLPPVRAGLRAALLGHGLRSVPPRLIAVPTTAGTGSEVTPFATLYHGSRKVSLDQPEIRPDHAVLDGALVTSCPPRVATSAALDALCHAVESSWNRHATTASRQYAMASADAMSRCLTRPTDQLRRGDGERRLLAATVAGVAIAHTRTTAAHAFSYWLTARRGIAHGFACAINLVWLARYNWESRPQGDRGLERVLRRLGCHPDAEPDSPVATVARCVAEAGANGMWDVPRLSNQDLAGYLDAGLGVRGRSERNPVDLHRDHVREHIVASGLFG